MPLPLPPRAFPFPRDSLPGGKEGMKGEGERGATRKLFHNLMRSTASSLLFKVEVTQVLGQL